MSDAFDHSIDQAAGELNSKLDRDRGVPLLQLEAALLLKCVKDGVFSGDILGYAFISAYGRSDFNHSLADIMKLDPEGFRLFHQILHIRPLLGSLDDTYSELLKEVEFIMDLPY